MSTCTRAFARFFTVLPLVIFAGWVTTTGRAGGDPAKPGDDPESVRDVFLLLDRRPVHLLEGHH